MTYLTDELQITEPTVEQVQDAVEKILIEKGHARTAKEYILYRAERTRIRNMNTKLMKTYEDLTFRDAAENDIKRENANIDGDTAMGTMLKYGSEGAKQFYEMYRSRSEACGSAYHGRYSYSRSRFSHADYHLLSDRSSEAL